VRKRKKEVVKNQAYQCPNGLLVPSFGALVGALRLPFLLMVGHMMGDEKYECWYCSTFIMKLLKILSMLNCVLVCFPFV